MNNHPKPPGIEFLDAAKGRHMVYVLAPYREWQGWIFYRHPDGQWVSLRKATDDDLQRIVAAAKPSGNQLLGTEELTEQFYKLKLKADRLREALCAIADPEHCLTAHGEQSLRDLARAALDEIDPKYDYSGVTDPRRP